jgi:hypothetical protein
MTWKHRFKLRGKKLKSHRRSMKQRKTGVNKRKVFKEDLFLFNNDREKGLDKCT